MGACTQQSNKVREQSKEENNKSASFPSIATQSPSMVLIMLEFPAIPTNHNPPLTNSRPRSSSRCDMTSATSLSAKMLANAKSYAFPFFGPRAFTVVLQRLRARSTRCSPSPTIFLPTHCSAVARVYRACLGDWAHECVRDGFECAREGVRMRECVWGTRVRVKVSWPARIVVWSVTVFVFLGVSVSVSVGVGVGFCGATAKQTAEQTVNSRSKDEDPLTVG